MWDAANLVFIDRKGNQLNTIFYLQVSSTGKRRQLASACLNMKLYASLVPTQQEVKVKFNVSSKKIVSASINFTISCVFLREGKAT